MNPRLLAEALAARLTRQIAIRWGESFPFYHVIEHPKSGGTWLARMVSDYLQIPFPQYSLFPLTFSCVVQSFGAYHPSLRRVLYLYRDGRDVMTSLYFDRVRVARHSERPGKAYVARTYEKLFGPGYDPAEIARHLPRFIEYEFTHPGRGTRLNWREHIAGWLAHAGDGRVVALSYEALRRDCLETLGTAIAAASGEVVDPWRLSVSVEKMSMLRQTGRAPGEGDATQHIRKGVVGDWRNYFSRDAAEVFAHFAGDMLIRLGYEQDRGWLDRCEFAVA